MTLFCSASPAAQLAYAFKVHACKPPTHASATRLHLLLHSHEWRLLLPSQVFDVDHSDSMDVEEMVSFFRVLVGAMYMCGVVPTPVREDTIEQLARGMFEVADSSTSRAV